MVSLLLYGSFAPLRWSDHAELTAQSFAAGVPHWHYEVLAERPILRSEHDNRVCVVTHPLEVTGIGHRGVGLARTVAAAEAQGSDTRFCSWFKLLRMPGQALISLDSVVAP